MTFAGINYLAVLIAAAAAWVAGAIWYTVLIGIVWIPVVRYSSSRAFP